MLPVLPLFILFLSSLLLLLFVAVAVAVRFTGLEIVKRKKMKISSRYSRTIVNIVQFRSLRQHVVSQSLKGPYLLVIDYSSSHCLIY
jgi:hypothetical protein